MTAMNTIQLATPSRRSSSKVCARCKKRKTKCDSGYPSCGACVRAGAVCSGGEGVGRLTARSRAGRAVHSPASPGWTDDTPDDAPRSLVRALEAQVAALERRVAAAQSRTADGVARALSARLVRGTVLAAAATTTGLGGALQPWQFLRPSSLPMGVGGDDERTTAVIAAAAAAAAAEERVPTPTPPPTTTTTTTTARKQDLPGDGDTPSRTNLGRIPLAALETMVANYAGIHLPQYPCLQEPWLRAVLNRILAVDGGDTDAALARGIRPESGLTSFDYFAVFVVLAVSSLTLTWRNERQARVASDAFFATAVQHLHRAARLTAVRRLQVCLLLAHYGNVNPARVDSWACVWAAVRTGRSLGLHRSNSATAAEPFARGLFAVARGMERSLSTILRIPLALEEMDEQEAEEAAKVDGMPLSPSAYLYRLRALETEVHRVLWLRDLDPDPSSSSPSSAASSAWLRSINARLEAWLRGSEPFQKFQMLEFRRVNYGSLKARLHRPTPRWPVRSSADRMVCVAACALLIEDYERQSQGRRLFYPWHAVHILHETVVVLLDAAWTDFCSANTAAYASAAASPLPLATAALDLLDTLCATWTDASRCVHLLRPLLADVTAAISAGSRPTDTPSRLSARIHRLLFPDARAGALTRSTRSASSTSSTASNAPGDSLPPLSLPSLSAVTPPQPAIYPSLTPSYPSPPLARPPSADDPLGLVALADMDWDAYWDAVQALSPPWDQDG